MPTAPLNSATRVPVRTLNLSDDLSRIAAPTLVVAGQEDVLTRPKAMEEIAAFIPGAKLSASIPGAGHMIPIEQPEPLAAILEAFLKTHFHHSTHRPAT